MAAGFRENLKETLVCIEELQIPLKAAVDAADSKEDCLKLINNIKKLGKYLDERREEITKKYAHFGGPPELVRECLSSPGSGASSPPPLQQQVPATSGNPIIHGKSVQTDGPVPLPTSDRTAEVVVTLKSPEAPQVVTPPTRLVPSFPKIRQAITEEEPSATQQTLLNSQSMPNESNSTKNPAGTGAGGNAQSGNVIPALTASNPNSNLPNSQRVYLPMVPVGSTPDSVYTSLTKLNYPVADVKVVPNAAGAFAIVGLHRPEDVQKILAAPFMMDNQLFIARAFQPREERHPSMRQGHGKPYDRRTLDYQYGQINGPQAATLPSGKFKVFCGGIPKHAGLNDVLAALESYGKITMLCLPMGGHDDTGRAIHRNIAYVHYQTDDSVKNVFAARYLTVAGGQVECKPSQKQDAEVLAMPAWKGSSAHGSMAAVVAALPAVPALPKIN
ncbi:hypothetical protein BV898_04115 [Hypsibius exemplaris]|uniref:RRM domain-containing protein n=1 Tax=Hypsibius exemplaris TaxID=2072580 RepID=A0A1W0X3N6_HYPEX|nr:hypothetical protein BV898_04115 [Hypsibius exemplaris]